MLDPPSVLLLIGAGLLAGVMNAVIAWEAAVWVLAGAVAGGIVGARAAARIPVLWLRWTVIGVGTALTVIFFVRACGGTAGTS